MHAEEPPVVANRSLIFIACSLVLSYLFEYFFLWNVPGIAAVLFTGLIGISLVTLTWLLKRNLSRDVVLLLALALFFSGMVAIRANLLLAVLNILGTILLLLLITEISVRGSMKGFLPFDYLTVFGLPLIYLVSLVDTIISIRLPFARPASNTSKQIIRGVLITVPILILFAALFAGADPVFHTVVWNVLHLQLVSPQHPYLFTIVFAFMCGAFGYVFSKKPVAARVALAPKRPMGHIETSIILGSVNALFVIFIALQATYLFGGIINITNDTFTYAEYARHGFFELIAIAACTYLIMLVTEKLIERNAEQHSKAFKYLSTALVLQVMVLMIFAFNRLSLYETAFGFTTLRLYSHAFILLLAVVYVCLLYKIFVDTRESAFALRVFCAVVFFVAAMNLFNPDAFIAQKNLERFNATGKIDLDYLAGLSSDATPGLLTIFEQTDPSQRAPLGFALYQRSLKAPEAWQSWNLSREREAQALKSYQAELTAYSGYGGTQIDSENPETPAE
jgi:hypothetical protein